jgi:hypothetical protein
MVQKNIKSNPQKVAIKLETFFDSAQIFAKILIFFHFILLIQIFFTKQMTEFAVFIVYLLRFYADFKNKPLINNLCFTTITAKSFRTVFVLNSCGRLWQL